MGGTAVSRAPGGRELGYAEIVADDVNATAAARDVAGLSVTVPVGSRPIKVEFYSGGVKNGTLNQFADIQIKEGGTVIAEAFAGGTTAAALFPCKIERRLTPSAGSHTYKITSAPLSSGTVTIAAAATNPAFIRVTET
jgi:hypothetical protein